MNPPSPPSPQPRHPFPNDRASMAAGYRHLAALIESGQAPIPSSPEIYLLLWSLPIEEQREKAGRLMRDLGGGTWEEKLDGPKGALLLAGMCGGLPVKIWVDAQLAGHVETPTVEAQAVKA